MIPANRKKAGMTFRFSSNQHSGASETGRGRPRCASVCVLVAWLLVSLPPAVFAHGDLFLRIQDLTARIQSGTNPVAPLYLERGELKRTHGDPAGAQEDYELAAKASPGIVDVDLCRARLLVDTEKLQDALALFDKVAAASPEHTEVFIDRARLKMKLGDRKGAIADYRKGAFLAASPEPEIFIEWARALAAEKQVPEALNALDTGVKTIGPQIKLHECALDIELQRANTNAAVSRIDEIIKIAFRKERWWAQRGDLLSGMGKAPEARYSYEQSIKAMDKLPPRLQQTPAMITLRKNVAAALGTVSQTGPVK